MWPNIRSVHRDGPRNIKSQPGSCPALRLKILPLRIYQQGVPCLLPVAAQSPSSVSCSDVDVAFFFFSPTPQEISPNIPSLGLTRFYSRASQALLGLVVSRNRASPSGTATSSDATPKQNTKGKNSRKENGPATPHTQPIPIANTNSDSTAITINPSLASAPSSSSSSSASNGIPSASNIPTTTAAQKEGGSEGWRKTVKKRGRVNLEEIPGTRVGPDDGPWPKEYDILETEEDVWTELRSLGRPHRAVFVNYDGHRSRSRSRADRSCSNGRSPDPPVAQEPEAGAELLAPVEDDLVPVQERQYTPRVMVVDSVNFQPCKTLKTQDRYVVTQLDVHGEMWTLTGVFDGHLGDVTVEHVAHHLPIIIREFLKSKLPPDCSSSFYDPEHISTLFQSAIAAFDDAIAHDILDLFGGSVDQLNNYTDADIRRVINDNHPGQGLSSAHGENWRKARLCMYGTTALVALMDPKGEGIWVANLGDCMGILVTRTVTLDENDEAESDSDHFPTRFDDPEEGEWTVEVLTTMHNGDNDREIERVKSEHPGEEDTCIMDRRVLGALAPTRCLGDIPFKQPPEFTRRVLYNLYPFVHNTAPWEEFLKHNHTPPYLSSQAEVVYRRLKGDSPDQPAQPDPTIGKRRNSGLSAVLALGKLGGVRRGRKAKKLGTTRVKKQRFLVLASDGFTDLCLSRGGVDKILKSWAKEMVQIGSPKKEVEETKAKLRDRENGILESEEEVVGGTATTDIPRPTPTYFDMSRPLSPASATSPVPFTANSFSSSLGSLVIPTVDQEEQSTSGMSTPAYAFSVPPTRTASPSPMLPSHPPPQLQSSIHASPLLLPVAHSNTQSNLQCLPHAKALHPPPVAHSTLVPRLQRPPLPHINKSYHCTSSSNMALRLLRCALGGDDKGNDRVAKALTIDMDVSWLDDTAIVVLGL